MSDHDGTRRTHAVVCRRDAVVHGETDRMRFSISTERMISSLVSHMTTTIPSKIENNDVGGSSIAIVFGAPLYFLSTKDGDGGTRNLGRALVLGGGGIFSQ